MTVGMTFALEGPGGAKQYGIYVVDRERPVIVVQSTDMTETWHWARPEDISGPRHIIHIRPREMKNVTSIRGALTGAPGAVELVRSPRVLFDPDGDIVVYQGRRTQLHPEGIYGVRMLYFTGLIWLYNPVYPTDMYLVPVTREAVRTAAIMAAQR